ncbi:hypothetical protein A2U01_0021281 [Trifolium medium]|uniref:Uncharacterized protein n=1 Tax=Trifolium medium TaxID=97028 RepID=A0A392NLK2_9FABA|nr:hypothetical protein [Trifolium medium]
MSLQLGFSPPSYWSLFPSHVEASLPILWGLLLKSENFKLSASLCPILHVSTSFTPIEHPRVLSPTSTAIAPPLVERPPPEPPPLPPSFTVAQDLKVFLPPTKPLQDFWIWCLS